jgi:hypothetical protein
MILTDHHAQCAFILSPELLARFWSKVQENGQCWEWTGSTRVGYGAIKINGRTWQTHRLVCLMAYGEIPQGQFVCHKCDNRRCVRPDHLFLGTARDNVADMHAKGRFIPVRGERTGSSKLTDDKVREIRTLSGGGLSNRRIAKKIGVSASTIDYVVNGQTWSHVQ